jgi:hypothetical protein
MSRARHHPKTGGGETGEKPMIAPFIAMTVLVGALLCAGAEAVQWATSGHYDTLTGIELWTAVDRVGLARTQAGIENHLALWIWDPLLTGFLRQPGWLLMGAPALLVLWLKQPKLHPRFMRRRKFAPPRTNASR